MILLFLEQWKYSLNRALLNTPTKHDNCNPPCRDVRFGLRNPQECFGLGRFFDAFSHFLAGLEVRDKFRGDGDGFTALGITTFPCWPVIHAETSEAADFDATTMTQRVSNSVEDFLDGNFGILGRQMGEAGGECGDKV